MFIRKEVIRKKIGSKTLVSYCRSCHGEEIETVQTCKRCGSHDIANPFSHNIYTDYQNGIGVKQDYKDITEYIYKCDLCGTEFNGLETDSYMSYAEGTFEKCNYNKFVNAEYMDYKNYQLKTDLCDNCKNELCAYLESKLNEFTSDENISQLVEAYINTQNNKE